MFEKVLVANRGEMAVRIIRACRDLGVRTVAIYSDADADSLPVQMADESVCIGPAQAAASYLNVPHIIAAGLNTGCDAVHPGAGFLAENAYFAEACERYRITFIGPTPDNMRMMGEKTRAREAALAAGLPVIPGSDGPVADVNEAKTIAREIGFPVMLKAAGGGGGRGIRRVSDVDELVTLFPLAQAEARSSFGNADLYVEKQIEHSRHVEIQVLGDGSTVLHLGHRECSIQRRFQKLIEEAPAPSLSGRQGDRVARSAVRLTESIGYRGAGTVEFLLDDQNRFYFIETNTRIQVEHPATEEVTGIDIVRAQLQIAAGEPTGLRQRDIRLTGHAIEYRLLAEDPERDFRPDAGTVTDLRMPGGPGVRVDTHLYAGCEVSPFYDSLLAKLIVYGDTRDEAIKRSRRALAETRIEGPATNLDLHRAILQDQRFVSAAYDLEYVTGAPVPLAEFVG